ncbi:MAG: NUDIX domain-containing protein [Candidatus Nealsonbacteria bacterium]|nr:NUDIX domain-containing protein [Candidatus Nealsonbacteria bacterium]
MEDIDVKVLMLDDNQILFVLEKEKLITKPNGETFPKPSKWGMSGGRGEPQDKDEIAVAEREVLHEIGIFPEVNSRIRVERRQKDYLKVAFIGYPTPGTIKIDPDEILDAQWFPCKIIYDKNFDIYGIQRGMAQELLRKLRK